MKKISALVLAFVMSLCVIITPELQAQTPTSARPTPDCFIPFSRTSAGTVQWDNRPQPGDPQTPSTRGCTAWHLVYSSVGFSAVSVRADSASDTSTANTPSTFVSFAGSMISGSFPLTSTTRGEATFSGYYPWLAVEVVSVTGTGTISGALEGFRSSPVTGSGGGGDATAANQTTGNASLSSIDGKITAVNTGAVVVSSSALPSGAATSALQGTSNTNTGATATSAASIDTKLSTSNTNTGSIDTKLTTSNTNTGATATSVASVDTKLSTSNTNTGATATSVASIDTKLSTSNTNTGTTATNTGTTATNTGTTATNTGTTATNTGTSATNTTTLVARTADLDTGAGTATGVLIGFALPASGGPVAGGTTTNPISVDVHTITAAPTGTALAASSDSMVCATDTGCVIKAASGAFASGSIASGAIASGAIASGAVASGAVASGAFASGAISDGADVTLGAKADAKSTATDTTSVTIMQVLKEISAMEQAPASRAVTNAGTFAVQATPTLSATGGCTSATPIEVAASDNHATVVTGAHMLCDMSAFNNGSAIQYVRLYDAASGFNGCNSATNLLWEGQIPGTPATSTGAGFVMGLPLGRVFASGISICVTGAFGQTSTTSATASTTSINIGYK